MNAINRALLVGALMSFSAAGVAHADDYHANDLYRANELSLDLFGTGSINQQTLEDVSADRVNDQGRAGWGFGVNYFFLRCLGISGEASSENINDSFFDAGGGNLVLRIPLGQSGVAPYVFGGGGYQFDLVEQKYADAGAGVEVRFNPHWGIFVDGRYVFAERTDNYGLGRIGLRLSF